MNIELTNQQASLLLNMLHIKREEIAVTLKKPIPQDLKQWLLSVDVELYNVELKITGQI